MIGPFARKAAVGTQKKVEAVNNGVRAGTEASDGLGFGLAPDLVFDFTLSPGSDGTLVVSGEHAACDG